MSDLNMNVVTVEHNGVWFPSKYWRVRSLSECMDLGARDDKCCGCYMRGFNSRAEYCLCGEGGRLIGYPKHPITLFCADCWTFLPTGRGGADEMEWVDGASTRQGVGGTFPKIVYGYFHSVMTELARRSPRVWGGMEERILVEAARNAMILPEKYTLANEISDLVYQTLSKLSSRKVNKFMKLYQNCPFVSEDEMCAMKAQIKKILDAPDWYDMAPKRELYHWTVRKEDIQ